ncbi:MAG: SGNH/GDSL hydrolase family protein [Planctomycetota bacterium]
MPDPTRRYSLRSKILAAVLSLVVVLLLAEGAMRVRQWVKYGTSSPSVAQFAKHAPSGLCIPVPGSDTGRIKIDSRGFRNDELEVPKPPGRIRLAFLGASTTFCAEASSNSATWPHLVCERLRKGCPGHEFDYVNAGVQGYSVEHSIRNLEHRVRSLEPDLIFFYEAANDLSWDTRTLAIEAGLFSGNVDEPCWLSKISVVASWMEKNAKVRLRMRGLESEDQLRFDPDTLALGYRDRLEQLLRAAHEVAPVVAVGTFCWQVRADQPRKRQIEACNTAAYYMPWMNIDGFLSAQRAYNKAIREAAAATGVALVEGEDEIPGDPVHFADSVHLTDAGCRAMAERVSKRILALPEFQALVGRSQPLVHEPANR